MRSYLVIPRLKIHNANAMSSPYTIGFPAMTAWMGAIHAIERRIRKTALSDICFHKVAVSCHSCNLQAYRGVGDIRQSIIGTANPLKKSKKTGDFERPPFIEEARCHLEVTLLIEVEGIHGDNEVVFLESVTESLRLMKVAGGDIQYFQPLEMLFDDQESETAITMAIRKLMPGYILIERRDLIVKLQADGRDSLGALLEGLAVKYEAADNDAGAVEWTARKAMAGWLVPIAVGFKALSSPGKVKHQRDHSVLHCFTESVVTLGEFKMANRFQTIEDMMWEYRTERVQQLYLCCNQK